MNTRVLGATVSFYRWPYVRPFPLRGGLITDITEARAEVRVRVNGRDATGRGAILLGTVWAWPDDDLPLAERNSAMQSLTERIALDLPSLCGAETAHPLELGLRLHHRVCHEECMGPAPLLARAVCASPFDAAIHDGAGLALDRSAFDFYSEPWPLPSADQLFPDGDAAGAICRLLRRPVHRLDAWLIVGPQTTHEEIEAGAKERGYRCFKLRIPVEPGPDVARTVEVFGAIRACGVVRPRLSVDSNEMHSGATAALDYLERLQVANPQAYGALEYLEQPTPRDLIGHPSDWRAVAARKPVIVDEGLASPEEFEVVLEQGWSGIALKTCKCHSFSLVAGAWAREHGLLLTMQDLTNPGLAAIHSALFAAHVPTLNGIELNSPQYIPAANTEWLPRLAGLLDPTGGVHEVPLPAPRGLGSML